MLSKKKNNNIKKKTFLFKEFSKKKNPFPFKKGNPKLIRIQNDVFPTY